MNFVGKSITQEKFNRNTITIQTFCWVKVKNLLFNDLNRLLDNINSIFVSKSIDI